MTFTTCRESFSKVANMNAILCSFGPFLTKPLDRWRHQYAAPETNNDDKGAPTRSSSWFEGHIRESGKGIYVQKCLSFCV